MFAWAQGPHNASSAENLRVSFSTCLSQLSLRRRPSLLLFIDALLLCEYNTSIVINDGRNVVFPNTVVTWKIVRVRTDPGNSSNGCGWWWRNVPSEWILTLKKKIKNRFISGNASSYSVENLLCPCILSTLLTYLLTSSLAELSPSWGAVNCAATQEFPSILWNPKVQYRVHNIPPLVWSSGICGGKRGAGAGFRQELLFPLPIFIPPNFPSSKSPGVGTIGQKRPMCRVDPVWTPRPPYYAN
jgi:hypothetical protein